MSNASCEPEEDGIIELERKGRALEDAATKVAALLNMYATFDGRDAVAFFRNRQDAERNCGIEEFESRRLLILVSDTDGTYIPDAFQHANGEHWYSEEAPWKAAVLEELRVLLPPFSDREKEYFDYATAVFRGEIIHPDVLASIQ